MQRKIRYNKAEVITMEKTMTLNLRVNPTVKQQAEDVLKQLGIPMATAIDIGIKEIQNGDTVDAVSAFAQFREQHR